MKRLLLLALVLSAGTAHAQVDPKVAEQCKDARDFLGCVKAFTTPAAVSNEDELQPLRNAMKIAAGRINTGVSLNNSLDLFRPVTDELSLVEGRFPNSLAVRRARLAHELFEVIRMTWRSKIKDEVQYSEFNQVGLPYVYKCDVLKRQSDLFDSRSPGRNIGFNYTKGFFGLNICKMNPEQHPIKSMWPIFLGVLREGSISPAEIKAREKAAQDRAEKLQREQELCALGPWNRYLEENPGMKAWAEANPGPAEIQKKKFLANPKNQTSCSGYSRRQIEYDSTPARPYVSPNMPPIGGCNKYGICR